MGFDVKVIERNFLDLMEKIDQLKENAKYQIEQVKKGNGHLNKSYYETYLGNTHDGIFGSCLEERICKYFGIEYKENDNDVWQTIEDVADKNAKKLTQLAGLKGEFYFIHSNNNNSYTLWYKEYKQYKDGFSERMLDSLTLIDSDITVIRNFLKLKLEKDTEQLSDFDCVNTLINWLHYNS